MPENRSGASKRSNRRIAASVAIAPYRRASIPRADRVKLALRLDKIICADLIRLPVALSELDRRVSIFARR
jgi:hypothetical protein